MPASGRLATPATVQPRTWTQVYQTPAATTAVGNVNVVNVGNIPTEVSVVVSSSTPGSATTSLPSLVTAAPYAQTDIGFFFPTRCITNAGVDAALWYYDRAQNRTIRNLMYYRGTSTTNTSIPVRVTAAGTTTRAETAAIGMVSVLFWSSHLRTHYNTTYSDNATSDYFCYRYSTDNNNAAEQLASIGTGTPRRIKYFAAAGAYVVCTSTGVFAVQESNLTVTTLASGDFYDVAFDGTNYLFVGLVSSSYRIYRTTNLTTSLGAGQEVYTIAAATNTIYAVEYVPGVNAAWYALTNTGILRSTNVTSWTAYAQSFSTSRLVFSPDGTKLMAWFDGSDNALVAGQTNSTQRVLTSTNGTAWTAYNPSGGANNVYDAAWVRDRFYVTVATNTYYSTLDLATFQSTTRTNATWRRIFTVGQDVWAITTSTQVTGTYTEFINSPAPGVALRSPLDFSQSGSTANGGTDPSVALWFVTGQSELHVPAGVAATDSSSSSAPFYGTGQASVPVTVLANDASTSSPFSPFVTTRFVNPVTAASVLSPSAPNNLSGITFGGGLNNTSLEPGYFYRLVNGLLSPEMYLAVAPRTIGTTYANSAILRWYWVVCTSSSQMVVSQVGEVQSNQANGVAIDDLIEATRPIRGDFATTGSTAINTLNGIVSSGANTGFWSTSMVRGFGFTGGAGATQTVSRRSNSWGMVAWHPTNGNIWAQWFTNTGASRMNWAGFYHQRIPRIDGVFSVGLSGAPNARVLFYGTTSPLVASVLAVSLYGPRNTVMQPATSDSDWTSSYSTAATEMTFVSTGLTGIRKGWHVGNFVVLADANTSQVAVTPPPVGESALSSFAVRSTGLAQPVAHVVFIPSVQVYLVFDTAGNMVATTNFTTYTLPTTALTTVDPVSWVVINNTVYGRPRLSTIHSNTSLLLPTIATDVVVPTLSKAPTEFSSLSEYLDYRVTVPSSGVLQRTGEVIGQGLRLYVYTSDSAVAVNFSGFEK